MNSKYRKQYFFGAVIILAVAIFIITVFYMLSTTDKADVWLNDSSDHSCGWRYEKMTDGKVTAAWPEFPSAYFVSFPGERLEALRMTRTFTETLPYAELEVYTYGRGTEVYLDGSLLYSDMPGGERNSEGFLVLEQSDLDRLNEDVKDARAPWGSVRIPLPEDYTGRELTIFTYYTEGFDDSWVVYPYLCTFETTYAFYLVSDVVPIVSLGLYALLALLLAVVFVLDISNGKTDYRTLLLGLYFLLLFFDGALHSVAGSLSILLEYAGLSFIAGLYAAPLYLYLALQLRGKKKYFLSGCVAAWSLYEAVRMYWNVRAGESYLSGRSGVGNLLFFLAVMTACAVEYFRNRDKSARGRRYLYYGGIVTAAVILRLLLGSTSRNGVGVYLRSLMSNVVSGYFTPLMLFLEGICANIIVIFLVWRFIRRTIETRRMVGVLEESGRLTLEGYQRMIASEEATNAVRHEMRHHMTALTGILKDGQTQRAYDYIASVAEDLNRLPIARYSANILVNIIAGTYLDKARSQGIRVDYSLSVPEKLQIADEDLSVFLNNLLENALQACERMEPEQERYIRIRMYVYQDSLFIGCSNSMADTGGEKGSYGEADSERRREHRRHGYGMEAMGRIAEKYNSVLKVDKGNGEFSVKSNLYLGKPIK